MRDLMAVSKALADGSRVRVLMFLRGGELCLCQLIKALGLAPSTVSKHMAVLYQARLVESRKRGRWRYYRLCGTDAPACAREAIRWLKKSLESDKGTLADAKRVKAIRKMDVERLCRRYRA